MSKKSLALTGAAATGALVLGTVGGAYACDLPGDAASSAVSTPDSATVAARIQQIEATVAKYDNYPRVSQQIAAITQLVEDYFTDPSAYQAKLTDFKQSAAYQQLQAKIAEARAAAQRAAAEAQAQAQQEAQAQSTPTTTPSVPDSTAPTPSAPAPWPAHLWGHRDWHGDWHHGDWGHGDWGHGDWGHGDWGHGDWGHGGSDDFGGWGH